MIRKIGLFCLTACLFISPAVFAKASINDAMDITHKRFVYDVYFKSTKIGKINRDERRYDSRYYVSLSADLSFLFLKLGGYQNSIIDWQDDNQWFKPVSFDRRTSGFDNIKVKGTIADDSHSSQIIKDSQKIHFNQPDGQITELNSMFLQVRRGLLSGQDQFDFYMQTSTDVSHYYFEVKGHEKIKTKLGEFDTIRLEQTHVKGRSLSVWFAPQLDMQMVQFFYHRKIVDITGKLNSYYQK